jgi:hypothetical protein
MRGPLVSGWPCHCSGQQSRPPVCAWRRLCLNRCKPQQAPGKHTISARHDVRMAASSGSGAALCRRPGLQPRSLLHLCAAALLTNTAGSGLMEQSSIDCRKELVSLGSHAGVDDGMLQLGHLGLRHARRGNDPPVLPSSFHS